MIILDNSTTGMTGHQDHAATGKTLQGDPTYAISIPGICRAMGVKNVYEINAFDIELLEKTIKEETAKDESLCHHHQDTLRPPRQEKEAAVYCTSGQM